MCQWLKILLTALVVMVLAGALFAAIHLLAQSGRSSGLRGLQPLAGQKWRSEAVPSWVPCRPAGLQAGADLLGLSVEELSAELRAGRSLADLAEEKQVSPQELRSAILSACRNGVGFHQKGFRWRRFGQDGAGGHPFQPHWREFYGPSGGRRAPDAWNPQGSDE